MDNDTVLLRQINPNFVVDGRVTSQAFKPTPKDEDLLSVYDGRLISAEGSHHHFEKVLGCQSAGVMGVSVNECLQEGLQARPDPEPFDEHAVIDFSSLSNGQINKKAKKIKAKAEGRMWLHKKD